MKAVAVTAPGKVEIVDLPVPEMREFECLVRVRACGFCNNTDTEIIENRFNVPGWKVEYPVLLGHEAVGEVVETGNKVRKYKKGDVILSPAGKAPAGTPYKSLFANMAEYAIVQDHAVMDELGVLRSEYRGFAATRIPGDIDFADATMLRNIRENHCALVALKVEKEMEILIYGDGPAAFGLTNLMKNIGVKTVICMGHWDERLLKLKNEAGADRVVNTHKEKPEEVLGSRQFDMVFDVVGKASIIREGAARLKPGGKVVMYGVPKPGDDTLALHELPNHIGIHTFSRPYNELAAHEDVMRMFAEGKLNLKNYYSHVLPMEKIMEAVSLIKSREAYKVVLTI